jgi:hypothetical protein
MNEKAPAPTQKIFDGGNSVTIEVCCSGAVLRKDTFLAEAFRNAVLAPTLTEAVLICKDCGKVLHKIK